ncbi:WGR domain-containing protein [Nitrosomonas supralitoralis]|uniref:WGR domain-containing protein n=1 Tax=Nitrosomonas supralitoralis TaxID=2116706 RepID=A0A2P7NSR7_9PROT|nr:WGR domain-containing protein [Nitrosomonas supralitoralis]PSJ16485.1 hypothetical protein C7H79_13095 [Nitrosomonas supralitoralis]
MDTEVYLEFRTQTRGYTLLLETDLFGDWIVTRYWFGLKNGRGSTKQQLFSKWKDAFKEIERIEKIRLRRGYVRL